MINPNEETFEEVVIGDTHAIFTSLRLDCDKLPQGIFAYDIRHADDDGMEAAEIAKFVMVNYMGTVVTKEPLELNEHGKETSSETNRKATAKTLPSVLSGFVVCADCNKQMQRTVTNKNGTHHY